jgi:hypothetical protein
MASAYRISGMNAALWKGTDTVLGTKLLPGGAQKPFEVTGMNGVWQKMSKQCSGRPVFSLGGARMYVGKGGHWLIAPSGEWCMANNEPPYKNGGIVRSSEPVGQKLLPHQVRAAAARARHFLALD